MYWFFIQTGAKPESMKIKSTVFNEGDWIPKKYSGEGSDINPPLYWENIPNTAKSLVLIVDDPDAPDTAPEAWVHWIVFNIPASRKGLDENAVISTVGHAKQGYTDSGKSMYHGPYPDPGVGVHHYYFSLYALDTMLDLPEGVSKKELLSAMNKHIITKAQLMGIYERK